jgi:hypothetical protein
VLIGAAVLLAPYFIESPGVRQTVAAASLVGWFALVLGIAFLAQWAWRRHRK